MQSVKTCLSLFSAHYSTMALHILQQWQMNASLLQHQWNRVKQAIHSFKNGNSVWLVQQYNVQFNVECSAQKWLIIKMKIFLLSFVALFCSIHHPKAKTHLMSFHYMTCALVKKKYLVYFCIHAGVKNCKGVLDLSNTPSSHRSDGWMPLYSCIPTPKTIFGTVSYPWESWNGKLSSSCWINQPLLWGRLNNILSYFL